MSRPSSPSIRNLSHIKPKVYVSVKIQGRMTKQVSPDRVKPTMGRWDDFMKRGVINASRASTAAATPTPRCEEYNNAKRTVQPQLNVEVSRVPSKKILTPNDKPSTAGNWVTLMNKTATYQENGKTGIRTYRGSETSRAPSPIPIMEKRIIRAHPYKQNDYSSHISSLPCSTYRDKLATSPIRCESQKKHYEEEKKALTSRRDRDASNERDTSVETYKKQLARFLCPSPTSFSTENLHKTKKNYNKESFNTYYDDGRLNHTTRGKRAISREISNERSEPPMVETLNPYTRGKKLYTPKNNQTNIYAQNRNSLSPAGGKGRSIYSFRTYASQVPL